MKLLCIDPVHALRAGELYTAITSRECQCGRKHYCIAEIPSKHAGKLAIWRCRVCRVKQGPFIIEAGQWYLQRRFIPWRPDELKVTEQEANSLYSPLPLPEEFTKQLERLSKQLNLLSRLLTTTSR